MLMLYYRQKVAVMQLWAGRKTQVLPNRRGDSPPFVFLEEESSCIETKQELNKISWNGTDSKYDIRDWAPNHEKMGKGVTLTEEALKLKELL